ncbi:nitrilase-related carbon-nitrogen hydrolase [Streptomyces sp. NPDC015684]|uniref:nitrilase-related carbon-nitrogen hydrolase n=1 Tax=Streptomyces sp. NPDC015684 TaxID=3364963 RepID=UPI0036F8E0BC
MRASLIQLSVAASESAGERRLGAASPVRDRVGDDLVVLPELWAAGAWSYDRWERDAEGVDGPTAEAMSAAARRAGVWLHAGSVVERDGDGTLYNTALLFDRAGELRGRHRKIHRYGFVVPASWPAARLAHFQLLTRTRALEEQVFLLACCATGTHGDMRQAGHSMVIDPSGTVLGDAGTAEETVTVDLDMAEVARIRSELPVLRDRLLAIEAPVRR